VVFDYSLWYVRPFNIYWRFGETNYIHLKLSWM